MRYPHPLLDATYLRRYQRFLVDVRLDDGREVTVHCPNTGSMMGVDLPGARCLVLPSDNPKRRLKYTLEAVRAGRTWVGAHPARANIVGREAIEAGLVRGVSGVQSIRHEVLRCFKPRRPTRHDPARTALVRRDQERFHGRRQNIDVP